MIISFSLLVYLTPTMGLKATGIAYLFSIAISQAIEMKIGLHCYDSNHSHGKEITIMLCCVAVALLSLFYTELIVDISMSILLVVISTLLVSKDGLAYYKSVRGGNN